VASIILLLIFLSYLSQFFFSLKINKGIEGFFSLFIYSYVHTLFGSFLPHAPAPIPLPSGYRVLFKQIFFPVTSIILN
jgi:hypothetical protein